MFMLRKIWLLERTVHVLMFAALVCLAIVGGTYSHAADSSDNHHAISNVDHDAVHAHFAPHAQQDEIANQIHCGADIFATMGRHDTTPSLRGTVLHSVLQLPFRDFYNAADPPPPRYSSINI